MKRVVDLVLTIDAIQFDDEHTLDDLLNHIKNNYQIGYDIIVDETYEEIIND